MVALLCSCDRKADRAEWDGVARVGGTVITETQVRTRLAERQKRNPSAELTAADRAAVVEELVQFEALFTAAQRQGWHTNAELLAAFRNAVVARYREEQLGGRTAAAPAEDEIRASYDQNAGRFTLPAKVRVALVLLELSPKAEPAQVDAQRRRAQALLEQARGATNENFEGLARAHSSDQASRYRGGDLGWLTLTELEGRFGTPARQAVANLANSGDLSEVINTARGPAFLKLLDRTPEQRRPLSEVRDMLAHQLLQQRQQQAVESLNATARTSVPVEINEAKLAAISLPLPAPAPPALTSLRQPVARP